MAKPPYAITLKTNSKPKRHTVPITPPPIAATHTYSHHRLATSDSPSASHHHLRMVAPNCHRGIPPSTPPHAPDEVSALPSSLPFAAPHVASISLSPGAAVMQH